MRLLHVATKIIASPTSSSISRAVALATNGEAVAQEMQLPSGTAELLWAALRAHPDAAWARCMVELLGQVASPTLVGEVVLVVLDPLVGKALQTAAMNVLCQEQAARHVSDRSLVELAYSAARLDSTQDVSRIVQIASWGSRHIQRNTIVQIVDGWLDCARPRARISALEVLSASPHSVAPERIARLLNDPVPEVRLNTARTVGQLTLEDEAFRLLTAALESETSWRVRHALREALDNLADQVAIF